jgi:hypothetical protein
MSHLLWNGSGTAEANERDQPVSSRADLQFSGEHEAWLKPINVGPGKRKACRIASARIPQTEAPERDEPTHPSSNQAGHNFARGFHYRKS